MPYHYVKTQQRLTTTLKRIEQAIYTPVAELYAEAWVTAEPVPYTLRQAGEHKIVKIGQSWGKLWDCAWFHFTGVVPEIAAGKTVVLLIDLSGEACLVDQDGVPMLGITTVSSVFDKKLGRPGKRVVPLFQMAQGGEPFDLWADAGCNDLFGVYQDSGIFKEGHIALHDEEMDQLYYDFEVLYELMQHLSPEKARYHSILIALHKAANVLVEYTSQEAKQARAILAPELAKCGGTPSLKISAIGHAHIDLAWLWPIRETIRKGARTFATVLALMERYPDYIFGASQPQLYQWMKEYYPELYKKIQARVAEGRWEIQGAMWIEPDTNISGGEALVRQLIYGKRFFREEFDKDPRMLWLPDVFGYTGALPQILKRAGVDYFLTTKISWNEYTVFPHHTFLWQGIDGSQVLTHMPPEGTYNSSAAPRAIIEAEETFADKGVSDECTLLFGIGDGGGGPGREHLERLSREKNLDGLAPVTQEHIEPFFQRIAQNASKYKTWVGELYLEKHQGTYTTQARNKQYNRKIEMALRELEFVATLALQTGHYSYPKQEIDTIWREALLYQFHDILPGSSIARVHEESRDRYQIMFEQIQRLLDEALAASSGQVAKGKGAVSILNALSWERSEWLKIRGKWRYITMPPMSYLWLDRATQVAESPEEGVLTQFSATPGVVENDLLVIRFAPDGSIISIFDQEYQREILADGEVANRLALYHDEGDAWEIPISYNERAPHYFQLESTAATIDGPQVILEQHYRFNQSTLQQRIILTVGSRRIDFVTRVDWREKQKMLRTSFPIAINSQEATCDIQFGSLKRPTHSNTVMDMARYEVCAHKWVDLSQWDYGVALLNESKYGYRLSQNVLDLNLLRSPNYPDPQADRAQHQFTYALYPHAGNHIIGAVAQTGYELNVPLRIVEGHIADGKRPFVQVEAENIMVEAVKKAEESEHCVIRLYEATGSATRTKLTFAHEIAAVWKTNLLEEQEERLDYHQKSVAITVSPFEIVTLLVQFS